MLQATPQERLALGVIALLLAAGAAVRVVSPEPPPIDWQQKGGSPADTDKVRGAAAMRGAAEKAIGRERVRKTPLADGERIDPNRASVDELDRLPRVGPALARRLVEWRERHGGFRSVADLDSVPGVGPTLLSGIEKYLQLPSSTAAPARRAGPLDLNRASAAELDALPGIGPVLAARMVEWRDSAGRFRSVEDLERVPGIGPSLGAKLGPLVQAGP